MCHSHDLKYLLLLALLPGCTVILSCGEVDAGKHIGKAGAMQCQANEKRKERAATAALVTS